MKYNIFFTIKGPGGESEMPCSTNPVEVEDMKGVLITLSEQIHKLSQGILSGCEVTGIRIVKEN